MSRCKKFLLLFSAVLTTILLLQFPIAAAAQEREDGRLEGYALVQPVNVYAYPSSDASVLKEYDYNRLLIYEPYSEDWYIATVYVNGISYRGYIHKDDVGDINTSEAVRGVTLNKINVHASPDINSLILKSYKKGNIIKYRGYNKDWYVATVYVDGIKHTGYIPVKNIETIVTKQATTHGVAMKNPTKVYAKPDTNANVLKSYANGRVLKLRTFSNSWYEATVYVNGKKYTGYISKKDIDPINSQTQVINGIGLKNPTNVYASAAKNSKVLKSYPAGKILKYRPYSNNWYEATVYVKGKKHIGYISKQDVEPIVQEQRTLNGVGIKENIPVYSLASRDSKVLKSYKYGHILKYRTFSEKWYEATVYIKGQRQTGYINKNDVDNNLNKALKGYAIKNKTNVYSKTSKSSKILKSYPKGKLLKYRPFDSKWFIATVYVDGKAHTGYISTADVSPYAPTFKSYAIKSPTNVYSKTSRSSPVLKSYQKGHLLKFQAYNDNWYKAVVYVKGKKKTGYIHVNDVSPIPGIDIPILMYHQIGEEVNPYQYGLFVSAKNFEEQMKYLKEAGYTPIHFDEIYNIKNIKKPIIITFDDGYENNMIAYHILRNLKDDTFKPKATFFIIGKNIDRQDYLSSEQIKEMSDSGIISIQSHTMTHPFFNDFVRMGDIDLEKEIRDSKYLLEELTGKKVNTIAYPYGSYNNRVINEVKKYYDFAVTTSYGIANTKDNPYELKRVRVRFDTSLDEFKKMISK